MCTALPPSRSPVITKTAATIHSLLWPTLTLPAPPLDGRDVLVAPRFAPLVRRCLKSGMTLPPVALRPLLLVRGGFFVPRRTLAWRGLSLSTLPRASPFLWFCIVCPILHFVSVDLQGRALRLVHTELLRRTVSDPAGTREFRDPDLESLPFFSDSVKPDFEILSPGVEPPGDRVQIDAPQHQQHGHHDDHRKPAPPARRFPLQGTELRAVRSTPFCGPRILRRERSLVPARRRGHQTPSAGGSAVLVAARSLAEALRGFSSISPAEGVRTSPRRKRGLAPHTHTGSSGGQTHRPSRSEMNRFTRRSSPEWKLMTTSLPPGERSCSAASSARVRLPNSSFTATLTA